MVRGKGRSFHTTRSCRTEQSFFRIRASAGTNRSRSTAAVQWPAVKPIKGARHPLVRILVVDNDADHLQHVTFMLRMAGFECVAVTSSAAAMDKFMVHPFDIILIELQMPKMDGIALAAVLKAAESRITVILMSDLAVRNSLPVVIDGPRKVVDHVINKPFSTHALHRLFIRLLPSEAKQCLEAASTGIDTRRQAV